MTVRSDIFNELKIKLKLYDKALDLEWGTDLLKFKDIALNFLLDKDYIFLNFGDCRIFNDFELKLSLSQQTNSGLKFTEIGGALNNNDEAKELFHRLELLLGKPDFYSETYGEIFTYWEDEDSKIKIYPRHHMGGEWFEYRIETKRKY